MEITHLERDCLYKALTDTCHDYGDDSNYGCFADNYNIGCPFIDDETEGGWRCKNVKPEHWREVFEGNDEDEPAPDFRFVFGDRVTVSTDGGKLRAVYAGNGAVGFVNVLPEGRLICSAVEACKIQEGWDD